MTKYKSIDKAFIDREVKKAKKIKLENQRTRLDYNRCETCHRSNGVRFDVAHIISVNDCQRLAHIPVEMAWDQENLKVECRNCHAERDGLDVKLNFKK